MPELDYDLALYRCELLGGEKKDLFFWKGRQVITYLWQRENNIVSKQLLGYAVK